MGNIKYIFLFFTCCSGIIFDSYACEELVGRLSACQQYVCSYGTQENTTHKFVVGKLPNSCRYIEYNIDRIVTCNFPYGDLKKLAKTFFYKQEDVSITDICPIEKVGWKQYCYVTEMYRRPSDSTGMFAHTVQAIEDRIKHDNLHSVFMSQKQEHELKSILQNRMIKE